jgi:hypothetical protein
MLNKFMRTFVPEYNARNLQLLPYLRIPHTVDLAPCIFHFGILGISNNNKNVQTALAIVALPPTSMLKIGVVLMAFSWIISIPTIALVLLLASGF